jgi:hypothetical protein
MRDRTATAPYVGMRWRDTTMVGVRPAMELTRLEPDSLWAESGRWLGIRAELTMRFDRTPTGCRVRADGTLTGSGPWAVPVVVAGRLAGPAIRHDLARAGDVLSRGRLTR